MAQIQDTIDNLGAEIKDALRLSFMGLGRTEAGAKNVGEVQQEMFWAGAGAAVKVFTSAMQPAIERYVRLNRGRRVRYPTLACPSVRLVDTTAFVDALFKAEQAGMVEGAVEIGDE